nr:RNA-directed DNA polymerase, eukaryota [Tanacetum cinerariifolium]
MGSQRSKEDDVLRISTYVFVTNFLDKVCAKDLWNACKQYGHVVDTFTPNRRSKMGKRFGFVRFIKVFDVDRLVGNLCTVWIGNYRLHTNLARFNRPAVNSNKNYVNRPSETNDNFEGVKKDSGVREISNSYAHVVRGRNSVNGEKDGNPVMVLDDSCVNQHDFSCCVNGKVKEFGSLVNLKMALRNEGFSDIKLRYLGGLWVMIDFTSVESKDNFLVKVGTNSWFSQLVQASSEFMIDGRVTWVDIEGIPIKIWSNNTFKRVASKWGTLLYQSDDESESDNEQPDDVIKEDISRNEEEDLGEAEVSEIPDTMAENVVLNVDDGNEVNQSDDPFDIYSLLKKNKNKENNESGSTGSMKYPPGFTPAEEWECSVQNENEMEHSERESGRGIGTANVKRMEWNQWVRGSITRLKYLEQEAKKDWVKELCVSNKVNFLTLQETKMESINLFDIRRCWRNLAFEFVHSDSVCNSGGVLCVWDSKAFKKLNATVSNYFVMVRGNWLSNGKLILFIAVYAPQELSEKKMLWDYLSYVIANWNGEVIIMGDFNEVRNKNERFGSLFNEQGARVFNSFISKTHLEDVPLGGCSFTWCHKSASKMSKLDRFLMSERLFRECPNFSAVTLERFRLDHRPILLRETNHDYGPSPFCFFHYWLEMEGFDKFIKDVWNGAPVDSSNAIMNFMQKLKFTKKKIWPWNGMRQCSKNKRLGLQQDLMDLDRIIDEGKATVDIVNKRIEVYNSIQELDKLHMMEAAQKANIKWAIEGDENSKYFHGILNKKRNQLSIREILVEGIWEEKPDVVKREFLNHFKNRFNKPNKLQPVLNLEFPNQLNAIQVEDLEVEVSYDEIKKAVWDCGIDKSPEPNGFTFGFYKRFWSLIDRDVVAAVKHFFQIGRIPKGCNSSFITLIPKIPDAKMVKDFRSISLIGSLYKIIVKILANRLVVVLGDIVNEVQSAFVANRQIFDGPFILNEVFQWCKSKKKHSFIFKIDFEKAYDSVLNGSPTDEFQFFKGLKQGDPLSPFIFILFMESLHLSFSRVVSAGKSKLLGIAVDEDNLRIAADRIGCGILKAPFNYLGSKVGENMSRIRAWDDNVDNMITRLSKWKMKTLSIGGRLTLIKAVLGSMSIYHMFIFKVPMKILNRMESNCSNFFNGIELNSKKSIWVKWSNVLSSKEKGGLGVSSLYALNCALMFKWVWRFTTQQDLLWTRVIKAIYGEFSVSSIRKAIDDYTLPNVSSQTSGLETEQLELLQDAIGSVVLGIAEDRWFWALEGSGEFSVSSIRKAIDDYTLPNVSSQTRGLESSAHLFFVCDLSKDNFRKICRWWNVEFMEIRSFDEWASWVDSPSNAAIFDDIVLFSFYWSRRFAVANGVELLIETISMDLEFFEDGHATKAKKWFNDSLGKMSGLVTCDLEGQEFEKSCNNDKILSEIQLEHEKDDEFVMVVMKVMDKCRDCMMVVKKIVNSLLKEVEVSLFGKKFEQDIDDEEEGDEEGEGRSE